MQIEWRTNNGYDSVLIVNDDGTITTWFADNAGNSIANMLVNLGDLNDWSGDAPEATDPGEYGEMVMCRAADGTVLEVGEPFAERLAFWF